MNVKSIEIVDPLEIADRAAIEVNILTTKNEKRWCFFFTPEGIASCGDWIGGTKVNFHFGASHMIVVSEISKLIIEAAIRDIEKQGKLGDCTLSYE